MAAGGYLYFRLDDEIRRQVETRFADHYRNFVVKVGGARFDADRGISIEGFSLTPISADGSTPQPILSIDEMYLAGNLRIEQLVTNQLNIENVVIRHAHVQMVRQPDGQWNTSSCCRCRTLAINRRKSRSTTRPRRWSTLARQAGSHGRCRAST